MTRLEHKIKKYLDDNGHGVYLIILDTGYFYDPHYNVLLQNPQEFKARFRKNFNGDFYGNAGDMSFRIKPVYRTELEIPYIAVREIQRIRDLPPKEIKVVSGAYI